MMVYAALGIGLLSLFVALLFALYVKKQSPGEGEMVEIAGYIRHGAMTFLREEYKYLSIYIIVVAILLYVGSLFTDGISGYTWIAFVFGALLSALAGNIGMRIATLANVRTAKAVEKDTHSGLKVAFSSGAVMGLTVVGLGVVGVSTIYLIFRNVVSPESLSNILFGFGFGASSIALFARVGGGIYTKAADVGADLVGKVEAGIPEDDPRNPAVIADNVGDNVGDTAGMGADLFESYVDSIISTIAIGVMFALVASNIVILPLLIAGIGIISSIIGIGAVVALRNNDPSKAMNTGVVVSALVMVILSGFFIYYISPSGYDVFDEHIAWYSIFIALLAGLIAGVVIGFATEYYTSDKYNTTEAFRAS